MSGAQDVKLKATAQLLELLRAIGAISEDAWLIGHGMKWNLIGPKRWSQRPNTPRYGE